MKHDGSKINRTSVVASRTCGQALLLCLLVLMETSAFSAQNSNAVTTDGEGNWDHEPALLFQRPKFNWANDPFRKKPGYAASETTEPRWSLTAVLYEGDDSEAILNGRRVRVGDEIEGRTVEEIGINYVLLTRDDSTLELNLPTKLDRAGSIRLEEIPEGSAEPQTKDSP